MPCQRFYKHVTPKQINISKSRWLRWPVLQAVSSTTINDVLLTTLIPRNNSLTLTSYDNSVTVIMRTQYGNLPLASFKMIIVQKQLASLLISLHKLHTYALVAGDHTGECYRVLMWWPRIFIAVIKMGKLVTQLPASTGQHCRARAALVWNSFSVQQNTEER